MLRRFQAVLRAAALALSFLAAVYFPASAGEIQTGAPVTAAPARVLVLPFRSIGVGETTAEVARSLLQDELRSGGLSVLPDRDLSAPLPLGADACDEPECAAALAGSCGAGQAVYGSLSRLGKKVIVRLSAIRSGASQPDFSDQLEALTEEDLDTVMRRFAGAIAAGRANAGRSTVEDVLAAEAREPRLRASRSGLGFRAGFVFPAGHSYADKSRMTALQLVYKFERPRFLIETTTGLGLAFGGGNAEWTILDLSAARVFGGNDLSPYLGAGIGVHSVRLERKLPVVSSYNGYIYEETISQSATAPALDLIAGLLAMRTFDFEIVVEARYHHVFEDFDRVGGKGAHGVQISIGTSR